jgi:hypothetical protein
MEDILDLYEAPDGPEEPVVCVDERPCELRADGREAWPMEPGKPRRDDDTDERRGVVNLFVVCQPGRGWRHGEGTPRRTKADGGRLLVWLADEAFPTARVIPVVVDNLNIHTLAALYEVLPPEEARARARRFHLHPTPKHASWLNMVEVAISALERQCLDRRIGDLETWRREVAAWVRRRHEAGVTVHWRFTSRQARERLGRSYLKIIA